MDLDLNKPTSAGFPPCTLINWGKREVYELRFGRLILGELDGKGNFVPKLDSEIRSFNDYKPGEGVPPIYNLPGKFVKKNEQ
jgi:hypothetical protein